jgi:glycosyltransferase involved in cell wall biosynthesis
MLLAESQPPSLAAAPRLKRVLYAIVLDPGCKFGSLEEQILLLGRAFQTSGGLFLPLFLCPPGPGKTALYHDSGLPAECLDLTAFSMGRLWQLVRLIQQHKIEIVHWNFTSPLLNGYLWGLTLLTPRVRHFFTDHNSRNLPLPGHTRGLTTLVKRLLLKRYRKVLSVSQFVQDCLLRQHCWSNMTCCLHFINTDRFQPDHAARPALRNQYGAENAFVVATVAHLIPAKGVDVVCRAMVELPEDAVLWVVGTGGEEGSLRRLCLELGIEGRVVFLGQKARVEPFLQAADCFVCPSLWAEAAGLTNLEAQASGLPVVASRIGGIPEYVEEGQTGLLFPPGDHHALAVCLRQLHDNPGFSRQLGRQARFAAVARFSQENRLAAYLDLYR